MGYSYAVLRGEFIILNSYIRKDEKSQINNLTFHYKNLEKEQQNKPKASRRKRIIKSKGEMNKTEKRKTIALDSADIIKLREYYEPVYIQKSDILYEIFISQKTQIIITHPTGNR